MEVSDLPIVDRLVFINFLDEFFYNIDASRWLSKDERENSSAR